MKLKYSSVILTIMVILMTSYAFSQTNEIKIKFIGNCGLYMTDGITNIYSDFPYKSGAHNYMEFDAKELDSIKENSIFIFTHKHADHYAKKDINKVLKEKNGEKYGPWNISELENLSKSIPEFEIKAYKTTHKVFGISFKHYSYEINWHGKKIYLSGDTESAATIGNIKDIDWAFVPYWLLIDAKKTNIKIDAKMYYIYHLASTQAASAKENWGTIEDIHPLIQQGEIIKIAY